METLWQDLKFAFRSLAKSPGFLAVSVLSLGLGIGANTAIFTIVKAVFLQPIPFEEAHRLVTLSTLDEQVPGLLPTSYLNLLDYRERAAGFSGLAMYIPLPLNVTTGANVPRLFPSEAAAGNYFQLLGVKAAFGRTFQETEDRVEGNAPLAVLSHGFWTTEFGADASIVGRSISVNRQNFTVIGVMPFGFKGMNSIAEPAMWVPMSMARQLMERPDAMRERRALYFYAIARLKPGVSVEQAQASMGAVTAQLAAEHEINRGRSVKLRSVPEALTSAPFRGVIENATRILMSVVGLVLLISCANVAALLLVRARTRNREFAVRLAVGAGRWRIVRQMLTESMVLSLSGGLLGLVFARWGRDLLWHFRPPWIGTNAALDISLDGTVLAFTFLVSAFTGVLFGLGPALAACRRNLAVELKERGVSGFREHRIFGVRSLLVMGQCALSVIALVGAGLFIESLSRLQRIDPGFATERLLLLRLNPASAGYNKEQSIDFFQRLLDRMRAIGPVESASLSTIAPMSGGGFLRGTHPTGGSAPVRGVQILTNSVAPRYFETAAIPLLEGREFSTGDRAAAAPVVIVNATLAKRFWPGETAVGKTLRFTADTGLRTVVGVAADAKFFSLSEAKRPCVYLPLWQEFLPEASLLVRTAGDPRGLAGSVREEVLRLDRNLPLTAPIAVEDLLERSLWAQRLIAGMLGVFGILALLLAAIGVYGLSSYAVSQRTSEIGIRMALGASQRDVLRSIVSNGMILVLPGVVLGLAAAVATSRIAASLLYGITATHVPTYLTAALLLTAVALVACFIPARRATKVDPMLALRHE